MLILNPARLLGRWEYKKKKKSINPKLPKPAQIPVSIIELISQDFIWRTLTLAEVKAAEIKQLVEKVAPFCWAQHETFLPNWTLISIQSYVYNLIWKKKTQSVQVSCIFQIPTFYLMNKKTEITSWWAHVRKIMGKRKGYSEKASASSSNAGTKLMSFEIAIYPVDVRKKCNFHQAAYMLRQ